MASARPSGFRKGGGGFLNGQDWTLTGYQFTDEFNGQPFVPGKVKDRRTGKMKDRFHSLYFVPSVRVDGADEDVTTTLFVGGYDDFTISDDGLTLTPNEDGVSISGNNAFGKFIDTAVNPVGGGAGFDESLLPEDEINYEAMIGHRFRSVQQANAETEKRMGGKRKAKNGREYDWQDLVIEAYYGPAETRAAGKAAVKTAAKPAAKAASKANGKASAEDVSAVAVDALRTWLTEAKDQTLKKSQLSLKVLQKLSKHPQREEIREWLFQDENLASIEGVTYDASDKNQYIVLEA